MKKLFVGCRVKLVWSQFFPEYVSREGRIIGLAPNIPIHVGAIGPCTWDVVFDGDTLPPKKLVDGKLTRLCPSSEQLEPILPEGHKPVSWEECLWQPELETANE